MTPRHQVAKQHAVRLASARPVATTTPIREGSHAAARKDAHKDGGEFPRVRDAIRDAFGHAPDVTFIERHSMTHSKTSLESRIAQVLIKAVRMAHKKDPYLYPTIGGSLPTSVFTKDLQLPTFLGPVREL